jgi:hypothetical protein
MPVFIICRFAAITRRNAFVPVRRAWYRLGIGKVYRLAPEYKVRQNAVAVTLLGLLERGTRALTTRVSKEWSHEPIWNLPLKYAKLAPARVDLNAHFVSHPERGVLSFARCGLFARLRSGVSDSPLRRFL